MHFVNNRTLVLMTALMVSTVSTSKAAEQNSAGAIYSCALPKTLDELKPVHPALRKKLDNIVTHHLGENPERYHLGKYRIFSWNLFLEPQMSKRSSKYNGYVYSRAQSLQDVAKSVALDPHTSFYVWPDGTVLIAKKR